MKTPSLPKESRPIVAVSILSLVVAFVGVATMPGIHLGWSIAALILGTFLADLTTAVFHFGFDYVWPDKFPIMGPISVEFRQHHDRPLLDPSALVGNLTRGGYMAITYALVSLSVGSAHFANEQLQYFLAATTLVVGVWGLFFHQVHSYSHMGKTVSPDEFNATVERISQMPRSEQEAEFAKLFERVGIPKYIRQLQKMGILLKPEVHWRHHNSFDSDFSSLNGWSDLVTNPIFGPFARYRKAQRAMIEQEIVKTDKTQSEKSAS